MKKVITILAVIFAFTQTLKAQTVDDSVEITLSIQARDVEYISGFIWNNEFYENLVDSIKHAYRKLVNPTFATPVIINGYTKDFIEVVKMLRNDVCAIKNNSDTRLISLLSALNVPYINTKIKGFTDADNSQFQYGRSAGKWRLVKKK
jgi:hypothetical protein